MSDIVFLVILSKSWQDADDYVILSILNTKYSKDLIWKSLFYNSNNRWGNKSV